MQKLLRELMFVTAITTTLTTLDCEREAKAAGKDTKLRWSPATQSYEFDTGTLFGCIAPYGWYHGVAGLMHRDEQVNVVRPRNALLNAEYYLRPGSGTRMYPRQISADKKTTHAREDGSVVIQFPREPDYEIDLQLTYKPRGDAIDMNTKIMPAKDVPKFEIFFASYVVEAFRQTWVPLRGADDARRWIKLTNREVVNDCFGAVRDQKERKILADGRWGAVLTKSFQRHLQEHPFREPILVARNPGSGFALVFLCDPDATTFVGGQYHGWDTAHDWCFGTDLKAGQPFVGSCRLLYRHFADASEMMQQVEAEWSRFVAETRNRRDGE
jgi:hypothetical protein